MSLDQGQTIVAAVGGPYADSATNILLANDAVVNCPDTPTAVKVKEFNVGYFKGTIRINFDEAAPAGTHWVVAQLYQNGVAVGAAEGQNGVSFVTYSQQITVNFNDVIALYVFNSDAGHPGQVRNFRIMGLFPIPVMPAVTL